MKIAIQKCDITPLTPCMQSGYIQRDHPYETIHDRIYASVFVLTFCNQKMVWVGADLTGFGVELIDKMKEKTNACGVQLDESNLIVGASHDHSAPAVSSLGGMSQADPHYVEYLAQVLADGIVTAWQADGEEVAAKYSSAMIDGLYSNRNDADKRSDKKVHLLGFFQKNKLVAVYCSLACHNTVLGPKNYALTGDLFGAVRAILEEKLLCPVLMAQGNAGDMGNRQYRTGQEFKDLQLMAEHLCAQIIRKQSAWQPVKMDHVQHKHVVYEAKFVLDASVYDEKIAEFERRLTQEEDYTNRKVLLSGIAGFKRKQAMGSGEKVISMPADIFTIDEVQLVSVPGELGSVLGLMVKEASKAKCCLLWAYTGPCNLGYMVDIEAYQLECQETNTTVYPMGVPEQYVTHIIENL